MAVVNEHPNVNIRKLYAGQVAAAGRAAGRRSRRRRRAPDAAPADPDAAAEAPARSGARTPSSSAIALLVQSWDAIAPWLVEALFADEVYRRAFLASHEAGGDLVQAIELADPEARDVLERAAVVDVGVDADRRRRGRGAQPDQRRGAPRARNWRASSASPIRYSRMPRRGCSMEKLRNAEQGLETAGWLLGWLEARMEARTGGV